MASTVNIEGMKFPRREGERSWEATKRIDKGGQGRVYLAREVERSGRDSLVPLGQALRAAASHVHASPVAMQESVSAFGAALRRFIAEGDAYEFALKVYQPRDDGGDPSMLGRFRAEVAALRKVVHPNVVRIEDAGALEDERPFVVTPFFRRGNLSKWRGSYVGRPLESLRAVATLLDAVRELHEMKLVHRDLKPENVLVADDGSLVVADFGLVLDDERDASLTLADESVGNRKFGPDWGYTDAAHQRDPRMDLYALAKMLWWLASGKPLLPREKWNDRAFNLTLQFPDEPGMRLVNRILGNGLASSPDEMHYRAAADMIGDVRAAIDELQTRRHPARRKPEDCRACQTGHYNLDSTGQWIHLREWAAQSNRESEKSTGRVVGLQMYRCDGCGHLVWYAEHSPKETK